MTGKRFGGGCAELGVLLLVGAACSDPAPPSDDAGGSADASGSQDALPPVVGAGSSLRFYGNGVGDIDRVKIQIDDPNNAAAGPPIDVGADFTIEFYMRAAAGENNAGEFFCGPFAGWINGNIIIDRDRKNQDRSYGISLRAGAVAFGLTGTGEDSYTICGTTLVTDGAWHHVAVTREASTGAMQLFVDGALDANVASGPLGDISYPDDYMTSNPVSDPFIVLGCEKHDIDVTLFPGYSGWLDEVRYSSVVRYTAAFARPNRPFTSDPDTLGLYHFDEGQGDVVVDSSVNATDGVRRFGGSPQGPAWEDSSAPLGGE